VNILTKIRDLLTVRAELDNETIVDTGDILVVRDFEVRSLSADGIADGWVVTRDSGDPTGLAWAAPGGGGGGDDITVNATAATNANFNDTLPAAPVDCLNVIWQINTAVAPDNVSAHIDLVDVATALIASGSVGTFVEINGGGVFTALNFEDSTPAAPAGGVNVAWQDSGGSASAYVVAQDIADELGLPSPPQSQTFNSAGSGVWQTWTRPTGHTHVSIEVIGAGGGGGLGRNAAIGVSRAGGGGGGAGGTQTYEGPAPATLEVLVGVGGAGAVFGGAASQVGERTIVARTQSTDRYNVVIDSGESANAGGAGGTGTTAGGSGGAAEVVATDCGRMGAHGVSRRVAGQAGGGGGAGAGNNSGNGGRGGDGLVVIRSR
jgi:hypothetical protein